MRKNDDTIRKILRLIRPYMHYLLLSLIFAVVTVALTLYAPILTGNAIDHVLSKGNVHFGKIAAILIKLAVVIGLQAQPSGS